MKKKLSGLAEAFYLPEARIKWKLNGEKGSADLGAGAAHTEALNFIASNIMTDELKNSITSIGHRIVHGGEKYTQSVVVTDEVVKGIEDAAQFAPLHNPAHLIGIREAFKTFPHLKDKNVVVFDTAFHQTMLKKHTYMHFHTHFTKNTAYVATVHTVPVTTSFLVKSLNS